MKNDNEFFAFDGLIEQRNALPRREFYILNPARLCEILSVYRNLKKLSAAEQWMLSIKLVFAEGYGSISIEADEFVFDRQNFNLWLREADNFEVYPLNNGRLRLSMVFYQLMIGIGAFV